MATLDDFHRETDQLDERRIYVLDDEVQVLDVLEIQLKAAGYSVETFNHPVEFLSRVEQLPPGVVVSDQRMPDMTGLHVQQAIRQTAGKFPMILLSGYPETRVVVEAMKQGAVTVLDKPYNMNVLLKSIEEAFVALDRALADEDGLPPLLPNGERYLDRLSGRERQVIDQVYCGDTNKSIAIQLGISIKTVEKHRGKAMKKMQVTSLAELVRTMDREKG